MHNVRNFVGQGLAALSIGLALAGAAEGGCRQVCPPQTYCDDLSGDAHWRCVAGRTGEPTRCETVCSDSYGAIAYSSQTGSYGYASDYESQSEALRNARSSCARYAGTAGDCRVVLNFANRCGAIAKTKQGAVSSGVGGSKAEAESASLAACRGAAKQACTVVTSVCSVD